MFRVDTMAFAPPNPNPNPNLNVMSAQMLDVSLLGVGTVLRLEGMRGQWSNDQGKLQTSTPLPPPLRQPTDRRPPPPLSPLNLNQSNRSRKQSLNFC